MKKILFIVSAFLVIGAGCASIDNSSSSNIQNDAPTVVQNDNNEVASPSDVTEDVSGGEAIEEPVDVKNYFLTMEDSYLGGMPKAIREEAITLIDNDNYYLEFDYGKDGNGSLAIFLTDKDEQEILLEYDKCGLECPQEISVVSFSDGLWVDFTDIDIPEWPNLEQKMNELADLDGRTLEQISNNLTLQIPHFGSIPLVYDEVSKNVLYRLAWNGTTFDIEEVAIGDELVDLNENIDSSNDIGIVE